MDKALAEGRTFRQFKADLEPTLKRLGWWGAQPATDPKTGKTAPAQLGSPRRLKTIYRTNLRTARAAGQWERIERSKKSHPFLIYRLGPSEVHRPMHVSWAGKILPVDDAWWSAHYPPNGWGCKCHVRQASRREAEKLGGPHRAPRIRTVEWKNKRTGKTERVPEGIDPGWDLNHGKERKLNLDRLLTGKIEELSETAAQAAVRDIVASGALRQFLNAPLGMGMIPVLRLPDAVAKAIGSKTRVGVLSEESALKNLKAHPGLTAEEYELLPGIGAKPTVAIQDGDNTVVLVRRKKEIYWVAVKAAQTGGEETFVTSFRRTNADDVKRLLRRGKILFGRWED